MLEGIRMGPRWSSIYILQEISPRARTSGNPECYMSQSTIFNAECVIVKHVIVVANK
jgi:hypothetical protein